MSSWADHGTVPALGRGATPLATGYSWMMMMLFEMFYVGFGQMIAAFAPNELLASILVPLFFLFVVVWVQIPVLMGAILMHHSHFVGLWFLSLASLTSGNRGCTTSHLSVTSSKAGWVLQSTIDRFDVLRMNSPVSLLHPAKLASPTHEALSSKLEVM